MCACVCVERGKEGVVTMLSSTRSEPMHIAHLLTRQTFVSHGLLALPDFPASPTVMFASH